MIVLYVKYRHYKNIDTRDYVSKNKLYECDWKNPEAIKMFLMVKSILGNPQYWTRAPGGLVMWNSLCIDNKPLLAQVVDEIMIKDELLIHSMAPNPQLVPPVKIDHHDSITIYCYCQIPEARQGFIPMGLSLSTALQYDYGKSQLIVRCKDIPCCLTILKYALEFILDKETSDLVDMKTKMIGDWNALNSVPLNDPEIQKYLLSTSATSTSTNPSIVLLSTMIQYILKRKTQYNPAIFVAGTYPLYCDKQSK